MDDAVTQALVAEIREQARLLSEASGVLARISDRLARVVRSGPAADRAELTPEPDGAGPMGPERTPGRPSAAPDLEPRAPVAETGPQAGARDWNRIADAARRLLARDRDRWWRAQELALALRDQGLAGSTLRGLAAGAAARLRAAGIVDEDSGSLRLRAEAGTGDPAPAPAPRGAARSEEPASARAPASAPPAPTAAKATAAPRSWDLIVARARELLRADPTRLWKLSELSRAVQEADPASVGSLRGLHFGLLPRLRAAGLIAEAPDGRVCLATTPGPRAATADPSPLAPSLRGEIAMLGRAIDALAEEQAALANERRTARVAAWAGRARILLERLRAAGDPAEERERIRDVFARLTGLVKQLGCRWVNALSSAWEAEDWEAYVARNEAVAGGAQPSLPPAAERAYQRGALKGLQISHREVGRKEAARTILEALAVLTESDAEVASAMQRFGYPGPRPVEHRAPPQRAPAAPSTAADPSRPPAEVLALTRGRRALLAAGPGAREEQRRAIERALELADLEWVATPSRVQRLGARTGRGAYDFLLFIAGPNGRSAERFVRACHDGGVPLIYIPGAYSISSVSQAIVAQFIPPP